MTWPNDHQGQQGYGPGGTPPGAQPPQPYQGSYPASPFDAQRTEDAYGGAEYDPGQYGTQLDPNQYGQPNPYGQPTQYSQPVTPGYDQPSAYLQAGPGYDAQGQYRQGYVAPGVQPGVGPGAAPGHYGPPGPGQRQGGRTGLLVGLAIAGLVLVVGVVTGIVYLRGDGGGSPNADTETSAPATTTPSGEPPTSTEPPVTSSRANVPAPVVPGWQVAVSGKRKLAYDVPPDWEIVGEETIIGFDDGSGKPTVGMSGAATFKDGYCAEASASWRGAAGFSGYRDTDLALVATDAAGKWGRYGYLGPADEEPTVVVAGATDLTVNGVTGAYTTATVRVTAPSPCAPPSAVVHAFAVPAAEGGSYVFIVVSDQEVPEALGTDLIRQIIGTVRATG